MMLQFHRHFTKQLKKLSATERQIVQDRLELFLLDPFHPRLHNHPLHGRYLNYRSIDIRPDLRAIYKDTGDAFIFVTIGTHSQLYR